MQQFFETQCICSRLCGILILYSAVKDHCNELMLILSGHLFQSVMQAQVVFAYVDCMVQVFMGT